MRKTTLRKQAIWAGAKTRPYTVYLPEELDLWLRGQAYAESRTLTAQTVLVLQAGRRAMDGHGTQEGRR